MNLCLESENLLSHFSSPSAVELFTKIIRICANIVQNLNFALVVFKPSEDTVIQKASLYNMHAIAYTVGVVLCF